MKEDKIKNMTTIELIKHLNELKIVSTTEWEENIPDDIWDKYFNGTYHVVESNLNIDKHRWYETSIEVIRMDDDTLMGIESITDQYNEMSEYEDHYYTLKFYEMEEIPSFTYKIKE